MKELIATDLLIILQVDFSYLDISEVLLEVDNQFYQIAAIEDNKESIVLIPDTNKFGTEIKLENFITKLMLNKAGVLYKKYK
ncbi:hypothetical protein [Enterococcus sp. CWB-B31]|uniref:hypothetical protein n=1 Tax=Enterococcus sp. CWB-B31 TaxID=2885159 RepID=UPI001E372786|nr:hypothetical protein [Enterococcus sp. CWB-B31]MCB5955009.1 hypothetical protein [Enterococcus sp. CWB-B31]